MGTRSTISLETKEGKFKKVYCHWDGYPSHNGKILLNHYKTYNDVDKLLNLGDMSILGEKCDGEPGHSFETKKELQTVYYGRDRGEDNVSFQIFDDYRSIPKEEYNYLFKNDKWFVDGEKLTLNMCKD